MFARSYILPVATGALAMGIFIADVLTVAGIAVSVLYVAVVLLSDRFLRNRSALNVALGCIVLAVIGLLLSPGDIWGWVSLANRALSIAAIGATAYLVLKNRQTRDELRQAQLELARIVRVTTLGELTTVIAHEVNPPLASVVSSGNAASRWLTAEPPNLEAARRSVDRIVNDGKRASVVISRIRTLVRRSPPRSERLDINASIMEVVALVGGESQQNRISPRTRLSNDIPPILGDRVQLQQVVLNLVMNAIEAMSGSGEEERNLLITSVKNGPNSVIVAVLESGPGLDETALSHLFDEFHTTKPDGMGMGLAISRTIMEAHGGQLRAMTNPPKGARFEFELPINAHEAA